MIVKGPRAKATRRALRDLRKGRAIEGARLGSIFLITKSHVEKIRHPVKLRDCRVEGLEAAMAEFQEPVELTDSTFEHAGFLGCYFLSGLTIRGCRFRGRVDFQCGGHNAADETVLLEDTVFDGFVNFYDCWFGGPVVVRNVEFREGTNLCGLKGGPTEPAFEGGLTLEGVSGTLDSNEELL